MCRLLNTVFVGDCTSYKPPTGDPQVKNLFNRNTESRNFAYCEHDRSANGILAIDACRKACGVCQNSRLLPKALKYDSPKKLLRLYRCRQEVNRVCGPKVDRESCQRCIFHADGAVFWNFQQICHNTRDMLGACGITPPRICSKTGSCMRWFQQIKSKEDKYEKLITSTKTIPTPAPTRAVTKAPTLDERLPVIPGLARQSQPEPRVDGAC